MIRAGASVALLAGFFAVAVGLTGGLAALAVLAWTALPFVLAAVVSLLAVGVTVAVALVLSRLAAQLRSQVRAPAGVAAGPGEAEELWAAVRAIAAQVGARPPDEIRLVAQVTAEVTESGPLLGLWPGRRVLTLGLPLVQGMTAAQLRAVLARELSFHAPGATRAGRLAVVSHRGRSALTAVVAGLGPRTPTGRLMGTYLRLYTRVQQPVRQAQQEAADQAMALVAGPAAAAGAQRRRGPLETAWRHYLEGHVSAGLESGYAPADIVVRFPDLLAARTDDDTGDDAGDEEAGAEGGSGMDLLPRLSEAAAAVESATFGFGDRPRVSFEDYTAHTVRAVYHRDVDELYRVAARVAGAPSADLGTVLDLIEAGRARDLMAAEAGPAAGGRAAARYTTELRDALAITLVDAGVARVVHSWSAPPRIVGRNGDELDVGPFVALLGQDPPDVATVRASLASLGVELHPAAAG